MSNENILFCFPYAGGSSLFYDSLKGKINNTDVLGIEYKGHGSRRQIQFSPDFQDVVIDSSLQVGVAARKYRNIFYFGYSMGALVAYEVSRIVECSHLFIGAFQPPHKVKDKKYLVYQDSCWEQFLNRYSSIPNKIYRDKRYLSLFIAPLKNDFECLCSYVPQCNSRIMCPITAFKGSNDISSEDIGEWASYTDNFEEVRYSGDHFFINNHLDEIACDIEDGIKKAIE